MLTPAGNDEKKLRQALNEFLPHDEQRKKLSNLPGVEFKSELPADPITRIFFQVKGDQALYQGTYDQPAIRDADRVQLKKREEEWHNLHRMATMPVYDFCHRLREGSEQRKRFVIVPATHDTKGCAQVLYDHGLVAGFRDFHNDRAFAVELKYFQNEAVLQDIQPATNDMKVEYEWSPKMLRSLGKTYGITNRIQIFVLRTWDGRIIDHVTAGREGIGGRGLMMAL